MKLSPIEFLVDSGVRLLEANPTTSRRVAIAASAAPFLGWGWGNHPSKEEQAFYDRLKSIPVGKKVQITEFPEIMAGVGDRLPDVDVEPENHKPPIGIDYRVNVRFPWTPIVAPAKGTVRDARNHPEWGNYVTMSHGWNYTVSAHMHPMLLVRKGQFIDAGTLIGFGFNSGSNAKGIFHYHLGTLRSTFHPEDEASLEVVNPHFYAENGRLGTSSGKDLNVGYFSQLKEAIAFVKDLTERLPPEISSEISKRKSLATQIGYIKNLQDQGILPGLVSAEEGTRIERIMSAKPTYTVFVNPSRPYFFHVVGFSGN